MHTAWLLHKIFSCSCYFSFWCHYMHLCFFLVQFSTDFWLMVSGGVMSRNLLCVMNMDWSATKCLWKTMHNQLCSQSLLLSEELIWMRVPFWQQYVSEVWYWIFCFAYSWTIDLLYTVVLNVQTDASRAFISKPRHANSSFPPWDLWNIIT